MKKLFLGATAALLLVATLPAAALDDHPAAVTRTDTPRRGVLLESAWGCDLVLTDDGKLQCEEK